MSINTESNKKLRHRNIQHNNHNHNSNQNTITFSSDSDSDSEYDSEQDDINDAQPSSLAGAALHKLAVICGRSLQPAKHSHPIVLPRVVLEGDTGDEDEELYNKLTQSARCDSCGSDRCYALLNYEYVPKWLRDNSYLHSGYRVNIGWRNSLHSACHLHNETFNIWTHLVGFILVTILCIVTLSTVSPYGLDRLNLALYIQPNILHNNHMLKNTITQYVPFDTHNATFDYLRHDTSADVSDDDMTYSTNKAVHDIKQQMQYVQKHANSLYDIVEALRQRVVNNEIVTQINTQITELANNYNLNQTMIEQRKADLVAYIETIENKFNIMTSQLSNLTIAKQSTQKWNDVVKQYGDIVNVLARRDFDILAASKALLHQFSQTSQQLTDTAYLQFIPISHTFSETIESVTNAITGRNSTVSDHNQLPLSTYRTGLHVYLPRWPLGVFMLTAMLCLLFSSIFHTFNAVSGRIAVLTQCLDYAGISLLITGSNIPVIYYGFYCAPMIRRFYLTSITVLGCIVFCVTVLPSFRGVKYRVIKTMLFISLGIIGFIPLTHLMFHFGSLHFIFWYLLIMGAFYLIGAVIYISQIPERWSPGKFDIWCSSHQLWHILIDVAIITLYIGLMHFYEWRMHKICAV